MGASTSTEQAVPAEQREAESLAASTGALPMLQTAFSKLADPETTVIPLESLQRCFCLSYEKPVSEATSIPESLSAFMEHIGLSIVDLFFDPEKGGVSWVGFLRGYNRCCGRMHTSSLLSTLLRVFSSAASKAVLPSNLEFESDEADCKISGFFSPIDVTMLLWMCWSMSWDSRTCKLSNTQPSVFLPDVSNLVLSAIMSCSEVMNGLNAWDCDFSSLEAQIPIGKFLTWAVKTVPSLPDGLGQFVHSRLQRTLSSEQGDSGSSTSSVASISTIKASNSNLLTYGTSWAISLSTRDTIGEEISKACFSSHGDGTDENLLYRSSLHGRGLNRFWYNVEGYEGSLLLLVSATMADAHEGSAKERKWTIGVLMLQGFENRDIFYGSTGSLYAINPVFHLYSSTGKEKNLVYSHLHPTGRVYEPHPKPIGIGFGGTIGNERVFIDEDFSKVTVRHHAGDKTYQPGPLFPDQGFLPIDVLISEVEVWGLGGKRAKDVQNAYKKREELFTGQRRKVDLKKFGSWDDSPEKMMMDMMSDPHAVQREDR